MSFTFHYLGTNGFHSNETSHTASYMIPELGIVFDAGSGFFRAKELMQTPYLEFFFSHGHMDHVKGIHCLLEIYERSKFSKCQIRVHAEQRVLDEINTLFQEPFFPAPVPMELVPLNLDCKEEECVIDCIHEGVKVRYFPLRHTTTCFGYRLEYQGKSIAYCTDTISNSDSSYLHNLNNLDVLFHEVNSLREETSAPYGHTDSVNLVKVANIVKPKLLVLIHHNPNGDRYGILDDVKKGFPNVSVANDKEFITI